MSEKYNSEISGPGYVMINSTTAMKMEDAQEYANSILAAIEEGRFLEKNGMCKVEYNYREMLGDWDSLPEKIAFGTLLEQWEKARRKASFSHGHTD